MELWEIIWIELVVFDELSGNFGVLRSAQATDEAFFEVRYVLDEHFGLLNFADIHQIYAEVKDIELVVEAKLHDASGRVDVPRSLKMQSGQL